MESAGSALPSAKQQRGQATIDVVLEATCKVLTEQGESKVRVQEISESTNVSIGSIYHHFGNREGLVLAAYVENFTVGFRRNLEKAIEWLDSITEIGSLTVQTQNLRNLFDGYFADSSAIDQVAILGSSVGRPKLKNALTQVQTALIAQLETSVVRLQGLGFVKNNISAHSIAVMTLGILIGRSVSELDEKPFNSNDWNQVLLELLSGLVPIELLTGA